MKRVRMKGEARRTYMARDSTVSDIVVTFKGTAQSRGREKLGREV